MTIQSTEEKLAQCLHLLEPETESIQKRMEHVGRIFTRLQPGDFPKGLVDRYVYIKEALTRLGPTEDLTIGSIENTTRQMSDAFANGLVSDICNLYEEV